MKKFKATVLIKKFNPANIEAIVTVMGHWFLPEEIKVLPDAIVATHNIPYNFSSVTTATYFNDLHAQAMRIDDKASAANGHNLDIYTRIQYQELNSLNTLIGDIIEHEFGVPPVVIPVSSNGPVINDHTCPTCRNDRCSKSEKTCWKCGYAL
jgi:hypothetical protein